MLKYTVLIPTTAVSQVFQTLAQLRSIPCGWNANSDITNVSMLSIFGFYGDFEVVYEKEGVSTCLLTIKSMT